MDERTIYVPMPVWQALPALTMRAEALSAKAGRDALPAEARLQDGSLVGYCDRQKAIDAGRLRAPGAEFALLCIVVPHLLSERLAWQERLKASAAADGGQVCVSPAGLFEIAKQARFLMEIIPGCAAGDEQKNTSALCLNPALGAGPTGFGGC